ncbi:MAG: ArsR/SmtB family transcription factor [Kiritimatiellia bacterium]
MALTPTLWRTCRVLAGPTRLDLLRRILAGPDARVADLAAAAGLSESRASQELRRLQARGLVQAVRNGRYVTYRPVPDPKVASAKPLLAAAKAALATRPPEETIRVATAYGHDRRLKIVRVLRKRACPFAALSALAGMPEMALFRHLQRLQAGGVVRKTKRGWELAPNAHPLARALSALLAD